MKLIIALVLFALQLISCQVNVSPIWSESSQIKAGSFMVIDYNITNKLAGNKSEPAATIPFPAPSFSAAPNLCYGIYHYEGDDSLYSQMFEVTRTGLTTSNFGIKIKITGITNIWFMGIRYIAISKQFPHHLNTFDNVPVNYTKGNLTNITSAGNSIVSYTNTINYTQQAIAINSNYTKFSTNLTNNKILVFMTSLFVTGTLDTQSNPVELNFKITATPLTETTYQLTASFGKKASITRLHFSMVIFDIYDVQFSGKYMLVYEQLNFTLGGGFYDFPSTFLNNFIIGLTGFQTVRTRNAFVFIHTFPTTGGVRMAPSVARNTTSGLVNSYIFTVFYLKTWICPAGTFFNQNTGNCTSCPIVGCLRCLNITYCLQCDVGQDYYLIPIGTCLECDKDTSFIQNSICKVCTINQCKICQTQQICSECNQVNNYFQNNSTGKCDLCQIQNCQKCKSLSLCQICDATYKLSSTKQCLPECSILGCTGCDTPTKCIQCSLEDNFVLDVIDPNTVICQQCDGVNQFFANHTSGQCELCTLQGCADCNSLVQCTTCDHNLNYQKLANNTCKYCNSTLDYFLDLSFKCKACNLTQCLDCLSLTQCQVCNQEQKYLLDTNTNQCRLCTLNNCLKCLDFDRCQVCDTAFNYLLNSTTDLCQFCTLQGCLKCQSLEICHNCDISNDYGFSFLSPNMTQCGLCNQSCVCDGYGLPWKTTQQQCTPICGDSLIRVNETCDDGNSDNGDGCDANCRTQKYYVCLGEPSNCTRTLYIEAEYVRVEKIGCNSGRIDTKIAEFELEEIKEGIQILNVGIEITKIIEHSNIVSIYFEYSRSLVGEVIYLNFAPGDILEIPYNPAVPSIFYTESQCTISQQIQRIMQASQIISYFILIISILSCKIVGLQLFGVLQLAYFSLSEHQNINLYLAPLAKFKTFNGLNLGIFQQSDSLPENLSFMEIQTNFLNNINIMLLLMIIQLIFSLVLFIISKIFVLRKIQYISQRLLKQGFISLVLFNIFNIAFSSGIQVSFGRSQQSGYMLSMVALVIVAFIVLISMILMETSEAQGYGEFKNKFKKSWACLLYIPFTIIYRVVLGIFMSTQSHSIESTITTLSFSFIFIIYTLTNLPFINVYQNYRSSFIHFTMLITLLSANYYRSMKSTTPIEIKARLYTPALLQLMLILFCIVLSFFVLVYEIYELIAEWRKEKYMGRVQNTQGEIGFERRANDNSWSCINENQ